MEKTSSKELEAQQRDFTEQVKKQKLLKYEKIINYNSVAISIFSFAVFLFVAVSFLFVGTSYVFSANFSFVGIYRWLDNLPNQIVFAPGQQLLQLIIGFIFLPIFIAVFIRLIVVLVRLIKSLICLGDFAINQMNPTHLALDIVRISVSNICAILLFVLATSLTTAESLPNITLICLGCLFLLVLAETVMKILFVFYDQEQGRFNGKEATLYAVYRAIMLFLPLLTLLLHYQPYLLRITANFQAFGDMEGNALIFFKTIVVPIFEFIRLTLIFSLFLKMVKLGCYDLCVNNISFYDKNINANVGNTALKESARKFTTAIIVFSSIILGLGLILNFLTYGLSAYAEYLRALLKFLFSLFMCISIKKASKVKVDYPSKLLH